MPLPRVTPDDLAALRQRFYLGQQGLDAPTARRLMDEIEHLRAELAEARATFATRASQALEKRLRDVGTFNHGGCPACHDAEARAFLAKLRLIVKGASGDRSR